MADTCSVMLRMPYLGFVELTPTETRATEACDSLDEFHRGETPFTDFVLEAMGTALDSLSGPDRVAHDEWAATIPPDIIRQVTDAMYGMFRGHVCKYDGPPHYRVRLMHVENPEWSVVVPWAEDRYDLAVWMLGPGPTELVHNGDVWVRLPVGSWRDG